MKKKQIKETQVRSIGDIVGNIQEVITWLEAIKKDGWETIELDWEKDIVFTRQRLETDKEFEKRKKKVLKQKEKLAKAKAETTKKELELYQKLKKKFQKTR
jgi:hypothetical protein